MFLLFRKIIHSINTNEIKGYIALNYFHKVPFNNTADFLTYPKCAVLPTGSTEQFSVAGLLDLWFSRVNKYV